MTVAGYKLTCEVFVYAEKYHRDLMEPWSARVGETLDAAERQAIMRRGLAATFRDRYPMPAEFWPENVSDSADGAASAERENIGTTN